jgi:hypothetical protein
MDIRLDQIVESLPELAPDAGSAEWNVQTSH